eukprot:COSAG03_NODE_22_length_20538_cov_27.667286_16_plen_367_part_00
MGECQILASTSLGTYFEDIVPTIGHAPPAKCCNECAAHEPCNSWTVVDFSAGADPQCHLKAATKQQAEEHKHAPGDKGWACPSGCDRTADERFTSGFLVDPDDVSGDVVSEVGSIVGGWWLVGAVIGVTATYVAVSRIGGRGWLWHDAWFKNLGGLVKDGFAFCFSTNRGGGYVSAVHATRRTAAFASYRPVRHETSSGRTIQPQLHVTAGQPGLSSGNKTPLLPAERATSAKYAGSGEPNSLHLAAALGDVHGMRELRRAWPVKWAEWLDKGDTHQYTPFHVAAAGGHAESVAMLLDGGADATLLNNQGMDGWELARALRRTDCLSYSIRRPDVSVLNSRNQQVVVQNVGRAREGQATMQREGVG